MKKIKVWTLCAFTVLFAVSCSSDDNNGTVSNAIVNQLISTVNNGTWRVTNFVENGNDETNHFTGYIFSFGDNSVLIASNGTNTHQGTWSVTNSNSNDDSSSSSDVDFNIEFTTPDDFADLTDDWDLQERTSTTIKLIDISGGNGGTDYLTFEKN